MDALTDQLCTGFGLPMGLEVVLSVDNRTMDGFVWVVLVLTAVWVYAGRNLDFSTLALAMFFPAALSVCLLALHPAAVANFLRQSLWPWALGRPDAVATASALALAYVVAFVAACVLVNTVLRFGTLQRLSLAGVDLSPKRLGLGFLRAGGEELGWRCFLLPHLLARYSPEKALAIGGLVWALYHVPVMLLLTHKLKPRRPIVTALVQAVAVGLAAAPHAWVGARSCYSFWAPTLMHATWNVINPAVLGSIYTQAPGMMTGEQWKINGEGLAGILVGAPVFVWVVADLSGTSMGAAMSSIVALAGL